MKFSNRSKPTKVEVLSALKGKEFISPNGFKYSRDFEKIGRKYMIIVVFMNKRMQVEEATFNRTDIDTLLMAMMK